MNVTHECLRFHILCPTHARCPLTNARLRGSWSPRFVSVAPQEADDIPEMSRGPHVLRRARARTGHGTIPMTTRPKEPENYLDRAITRLALERARKLMAAGFIAEEAARHACPGSWSEFLPYVHVRLTSD